jgi:3-deoxy-7-phosphoheptulonate synthase
MTMTDINIEKEIPVVSPREIHKEFPLSSEARETVTAGRSDFINILNNVDHRMVVMVGPCSINDKFSAFEYAERLKFLSNQVKETIRIIMRVYFEKPRTTVGWTGLIADPDLSGEEDFNKGLRLGREIMLRISEIGLPIVTEFLDPRVPRYISDLVTTGTIGARTTESQTHRQMASGLSMPIGFKNSTDGTIKNALDARESAASKHAFLGINMDGAQVTLKTRGNKNGYIILRGGNNTTNYDVAAIESALAEINKRTLHSKIVVDCSHGNSLKKYENQAAAFNSVITQRCSGKNEIAGVMLESNLVEGSFKDDKGKGFQAGETDLNQLIFGQSITDECIGWEETERLILDAHYQIMKQLQPSL